MTKEIRISKSEIHHSSFELHHTSPDPFPAMPLKTHLDDEPTLKPDGDARRHVPADYFFMLGTRFIDDERKIGLRVPDVVDRGALTAAPASREVNVFRDGTITLDKKTVTLDELTTHLAAARRQYTDLGVLVARRRPRRVPEHRLRSDSLQTGGRSRPLASPFRSAPLKR